MMRSRSAPTGSAPLPRLGAPLWIFSIASTLSITGGVIQRVAVGWSVWEATHNTAWVAAAALADLLPTLIVSIPAGALVDRFQPARTFWLSQIAAAAQAAVLWMLAVTHQLNIAWLLACTVYLGVCNAFTVPGRLAYMTQLTPRECFPRAVVLYSLGSNVAFFVGPMIASILISVFGMAGAYGANVIAYIPMITVALTLPARAAIPTEPVAAKGVIGQMHDGLTYARRNQPIFLMLLSFAAIACTARGIMELAPSIAATVLEGDLKTLSWMMSSFAIGALGAGAFIARWSNWPARPTIIVTLTGSALSLIGYGACGNIVIALASAGVLGFAVAANNICVNSAIQMHSAPDYRGRINSLYNMIFKGGPAVGAAIFGWLAQLTNVRLATLSAAIVLTFFLLILNNLATIKAIPKVYSASTGKGAPDSESPVD
jgi:MFS family permease